MCSVVDKPVPFRTHLLLSRVCGGRSIPQLLMGPILTPADCGHIMGLACLAQSLQEQQLW